MSFYNMLFGRNPQSALLLAAVGFKENDVERFRDVSVEDGGKTIAIYTRTGGGNRDDYPNEALTSSPLYSHGEDDDFDNTYRTFYMKVPDEFVSDVAKLGDILGNGLRKKFGQHLLRTLKREPTEGDKARAAYDAELAKLSRTSHFKANGHTFVPLDDAAMKTALEIAEENGGSLRTAWGIMPLALTIQTNHQPYPKATDPEYAKNITRAKIDYSHKWEVDEDYWRHCQERWADTFPLTMARIAESVERYLAKAKVPA